MNLGRRLWKAGPAQPTGGPVHVSMNDFLIHRRGDIVRVAWEGLRFRRAWPRTEGSLGLWFATFNRGRRQVSVSIWTSPEPLRGFVRTDHHRRVMREYRDAGALFTNAWTSPSFDRDAIWQEAEDRLMGRVAGVPHH